jgi:hypothetical protein
MTTGGHLQPIETYYAGHRFRSRTEARWAVFFKTLGLAYEYEAEGYRLSSGEPYLPDFWLSDLESWFEVKGRTPSNEDLRKAALLSAGSGFDVLLGIGAPDAALEEDQLIWFERSLVQRWQKDLSDHVQPFYCDALGRVPIPVRFSTTKDDRLVLVFGDNTRASHTWSFTISPGKLDAAAASAAYARFEHGEAPA